MARRETGNRYAEAALASLRKAIGTRELYLALHGTEPGRQDLQALRNRLNPARSNPGADFLGLCAERVPGLGDMTLAEFFGIEAGEEEGGR